MTLRLARRATAPLALGTAGIAVAALLTGCVPNAGSAGGATTVLDVTATSDACTVSKAEAPSGPVTFRVKNTSDKVTEFYLLGENKLSIVGEVENIAPNSTRDLTVVADPGSYFTACKPGMVGANVGQAAFAITGKATTLSGDDQKAADAAVASYIGYVKAQASELLPNVQKFVDAYEAGKDDEARKLFPLARVNYERIEPTASQFGDLDPAIDYRKPGAEAEGIPFTGFHRIEMDLWLDQAKKNYPNEKLAPLDQAGRKQVGDKLVADVTKLHDLVNSKDFTLTLADITNGAVSLLDEVAAPDGKLPGEENEFAHTDLYDFTANVEGAQVAFDTVKKIAEAKGAEGKKLVTELDRQFAGMLDLLSQYGSFEKGFVDYSTVDQNARNELGAQLNALSEPLSKLTHTVLGLPAAQ